MYMEAEIAMPGNENSDPTRRKVIKASGGAVAAGVASLAVVGSASAASDEIDSGDIVSLWNDSGDVPTYDNLDFDGRQEYPDGTSGEVIQSTQAYQQTWYQIDIYGDERWAAEGFVRFERDA
ncbi:hypothetical protein [Halostagnicola sp. A56]|uniref:hypothetical protein n=1 Tax=Halostagnicola sp. A56 TaxID=1495067 RepID=UPI0018CFE32E|nr:hypothetical protein [Halostagnicola sp. A56]